jgi:hypothetical protein
VLFALANLIDLAVQGRDRFSLETAAGLLLITGTVYIAALRPRIAVDDDGLTIVNPVREHRIGWAAVAAVDATELVRVRCAWQAGEVTRERVIYAWAVHSSRRKQAAMRMRGERGIGRVFGSAGLGSAGLGSGAGFGSGAGRWPAGSPGWRSGVAAPAGDAPAGPPGGVQVPDAEHVATALAERGEQVRSAAAAAGAVPPVSRWHWPSVAAVLAPALALMLVIVL